MSIPPDTFEAKVDTIVSQMTTDDKGNLQLPDGVEASEEVLYSAKLVKRQRDTQSAFTKSQQRLKALEAENDKLATSWEQDAISNLSHAEQARLTEMKVQDPDMWRLEIAKIEESKRGEFKEKRSAISAEASQATELERRAAVVGKYNEENPDAQITQDAIDNDVPPRLTKQLAEGSLSFDEYLAKVATYLNKGKVLQPGVTPPSEPDFAGARGANSPTTAAVRKQLSFW